MPSKKGGIEIVSKEPTFFVTLQPFYSNCCNIITDAYQLLGQCFICCTFSVLQYPSDSATKAEEDVVEFCKNTTDLTPYPVIELPV